MYSERTRTQALKALNNGNTLKQVAKRHGVSTATLTLWKRKSMKALTPRYINKKINVQMVMRKFDQIIALLK